MRRLRAGETTTDIEILQRWTAEGGGRRTTLTASGPPLTFEFEPDLPAGARNATFRVNGVATELSPDGSLEVTVGDAAPAGNRAEIVVAWEDGLAVAPPRIDLEPGGTSGGLRILDFSAAADGWSLSVEGTAGRTYDIALFGTPVVSAVMQGAARVSDRGAGVVEIEFAEGEGRVPATVRLTPAG